MSQKYNDLDSGHKYNLSPLQILSSPSTSSTSTSSIHALKASLKLPVTLAMSTIKQTYHRVPANPPRPSTDSEDSISTTARLISDSPHAPKDGPSFAIHPTKIIRLIILGLLFVSFEMLLVVGRPVPLLVMLPVAFARTLQVLLCPTPLTARWRGWRVLNLFLDATIVGLLIGFAAVAFRVEIYHSWVRPNKPGSITTWVAS
jgi:hypothetical protein